MQSGARQVMRVSSCPGESRVLAWDDPDAPNAATVSIALAHPPPGSAPPAHPSSRAGHCSHPPIQFPQSPTRLPPPPRPTPPTFPRQSPLRGDWPPPTPPRTAGCGGARQAAGASSADISAHPAAAVAIQIVDPPIDDAPLCPLLRRTGRAGREPRRDRRPRKPGRQRRRWPAAWKWEACLLRRCSGRGHGRPHRGRRRRRRCPRRGVRRPGRCHRRPWRGRRRPRRCHRGYAWLQHPPGRRNAARRLCRRHNTARRLCGRHNTAWRLCGRHNTARRLCGRRNAARRLCRRRITSRRRWYRGSGTEVTAGGGGGGRDGGGRGGGGVPDDSGGVDAHAADPRGRVRGGGGGGARGCSVGAGAGAAGRRGPVPGAPSLSPRALCCIPTGNGRGRGEGMQGAWPGGGSASKSRGLVCISPSLLPLRPHTTTQCSPIP
jgi:hypothetical protein